MVKENCLSVFQFLHPMRYYLWHPLEFFEEVWHMLRRAHQRATKGYCCWDRANITEILPLYLINILEDFAENNDERNAEICSTVQALRDSVEGFPEGYDDIASLDRVVLTDEYWQRITEVNRWRAERFQTAWNWIAENLTFLQLG